MNTCLLGPQLIYSNLENDAELAPLVDAFVEELPDRIAAMRDAADSGDWQRLKELAHQLKGTAGSFGFGPITEKASHLEQVLRSGELRQHIYLALFDLEAACRLARPSLSAV